MTDLSIIVLLDDNKNNIKRCYDTIINQLQDNHELYLWGEEEDIEIKTMVDKSNNKNIHYYTGSRKSIIRKLKGRYTLYLSSNDVLEKSALQIITKYINRKNYDLIITDYFTRKNNKKKRVKEKSFNKKNCSSLDESIEIAIKKEVSNKIVRTCIIKDNNELQNYDNCMSIGKIDKALLITEYKENKNSRIIDNIKNNIIIISLFIIMFLCGIISIKTVGGYFDEDSEKDILRMNIISYSEKLKIKRSYAKRLREMGLIPITESVERDHGIAPYYPYIIFFKLHSPALENISWHLYTYIICFIGAICMYLIIRNILKSKYLSILLAATYFFSPRIFADSMYNNKDMILLTLLIISFYILIRLINKKNYFNAIMLGLVCAFLCNVKVLGFYFIGIYALVYYINLIVKKEFTLRNNIIGIVTVVSWFICYIAITPAIWCGNDGIKLIEHIKWGLEQSSNFSRLRPTVRFQGINYRRDINPLPWYYIPKMIVITSPLIVIVLFIVSIIIIVVDIIKKLIKRVEISNELIIVITAILLFSVPFSIATFNKPNVYNGWRHFYFLYGLIIIVAAYAIKYFQTKKYCKNIINIILVLSLSYYLIGNLINGVGGMTYYNVLVNNNKNIDYETDYYGVTTKGSIEKILKKYPDKTIYLYSREGSSAHASLYTSVNKLRRRDSKRVNVINTQEEYEKIKNEEDVVLYFYNTNYNKKEEVDGMESIYTYKSWYKVINEFYK